MIGKFGIHFYLSSVFLLIFLRPKLNAVLALINKRCAQIKSVITSIVADALVFVDQSPSRKSLTMYNTIVPLRK